MKAAKAWCMAGVLVVAGLSTVSCGKDEGKGNDDTGMIIGGNGGSAGSSGNPGRAGGGNTSTGGTGGTGQTFTATRLGQPCEADSQCDDPAAPGLVCITASDDLGNGAPPNGLCSAPCMATAAGDNCADYGPGAFCYPFSTDTNATEGYCVEGCFFGDMGITATKCHDRLDFACSPAGLGNTQDPCGDSTECQAGEVCLSGTCQVVFAGCLPACRGDIDCAEGKFCDLTFLAGTCVDEKPPGKGLGEPCSIVGDEPDDCIGFCQEDTEGGSTGHCQSTCSLGSACAYDNELARFKGACITPTLFSPEGDVAVGDWGFCRPTCNCAAECNDAELGCYKVTEITLPTDTETGYSGAGLCFGIDPAEPQYDECVSMGGAGGMTGAGGDTSSAGGASAGAGGAP
ncbi:MAG TPA: hypothetical protein VIW29_14240 [Polyangiaceae bacterium]